MRARGWAMRFLKHVERTLLIAHLVDTSAANDHDPVRDFEEVICGELAAFSPALSEKPMMRGGHRRLDATTDREHLDELRDYCAEKGLEFHAISSATGEGVPALVRSMADALDKLKPAPAPVGCGR